MYNTQLISWPIFFAVACTLIFVWILTVRTQVGRRIIDEETPWNIRQWSRLLVVLCITAFILVNTISHLTGFLVLVGLYHFLVGDLREAKQLLVTAQGRKGRRDLTMGIDDHRMSVRLLCKSMSDQRLMSSRQTLERCLFSFPYIDLAQCPTIQHLGGEFEVEAKLSDAKYLSSLVDYIRHAGLEVNHKK